MCFSSRGIGLIAYLPVAFVLIGSYGCSFPYYLKLSMTEARILWNRVPIDRLLDEETLTDEARGKLRLVLRVRQFSAESLGLKVRGYYSHYSPVEKGIRLYVLAACRKDSLEPVKWNYPVIGSLPYRGFFNRRDAEKEAERYGRKGFDVYLRETAGYSTLGWFYDPLLPHHLELSRVDLVNTVIHEIFHSNVFIKNRAEFNEVLANFVAIKGTVEFFRNYSGEESEDFINSLKVWENALLFSKALGILLNRLEHLYKSELNFEKKIAMREEILEEWKEEVKGYSGDSDLQRRIGHISMNNALIYSLLLYYRDLYKLEEFLSDGLTLRDIISILRKYRGQEEPLQFLKRALENFRLLH